MASKFPLDPPNTGRYYRSPNNPRNIPLYSVTSRQSVINILKRREIGVVRGSFQNEIISTKNKFQYIEEKSVNPCADSSDVDFVKGGQCGVFILYKNNGVAGEAMLVDTNQQFTATPNTNFQLLKFVSPMRIIDLCEVLINNSRWFAFALKQIEDNACQLQLMSNNVEDMDGWRIIITRDIYCLAGNNFSKVIAYGSDKLIKFTGFSFSSVQTQSQVHSIAFNKIGNVLYFGEDRGTIGRHDLRAPVVFYKQLHSTGINELHMMEDERQFICGGFDGMLSSVDTRMMKPVLQYLGHIRFGDHKIPISIDEQKNLMCATGIDNITRLWSLKDSHPIQCIEPRIDGSSCRSWLTSNDYEIYLNQYQNNNMYIYSTSEMTSSSPIPPTNSRIPPFISIMF